MKIGILDAATLGTDLDLSPLEQCGELIIYDLTLPHEVKERIADLDIILTNKVLLNETNLPVAKNLKMIGLFATGYNNIDIDYAREHHIAIANVAGYSTQSVVQHTFALLLSLMEQIALYDEYVKSGHYVRSKTFTYIRWPYQELDGKTFGIIGLGAIGRAVAQVATAFGMNVIYYSTSGKNHTNDYKQVDLPTLLQTSDIISIHAPYNERTHHLIDYDALKQMKSTAYLLNLGRGNIIVEKDLAKALNENLIAGAGLDVLEKEPMQEDNPLLSVKDKTKLIITPHIAWASIEARNRLVQEVVLNINAFKEGQERNRIV